MSYNRGNNFDGQSWYESEMHARTQTALQRRQEEYEREHRRDDDRELLRLLQEQARAVRGPLFPTEFLGSELYIKRFGSWERALYIAGLPVPYGVKRRRDTRLYREEYARQQKLYRAERDAKRAVRHRKLIERDMKAAGDALHLSYKSGSYDGLE